MARGSTLLGLLLVPALLTVGAAGAQETDGEPAAKAALPEFLRDPALTPFAGREAIVAHPLRGLTGEVATLILHGQPGGEIAMEALALALPGPDGQAEVQVLVEIDGATFVEHSEADVVRVEVYAYALLADGKVGGYLAEVFAVDLGELGEAVWQSGLKYYGQLELKPGSYRLRVLVRNYQSQAAALRETFLEVPASAAEPLLLPLFPGPRARDAWLPVRPGRPAAGEYPFVVAGEAVSPAAWPVVVAGRPVRVHLLAFHLPPGQLQGRVELMGADRQVVARAEVEILGREAAPRGDPGAEIVDLRFEAPEVEVGDYPLSVVVAGRDREVRSAPIPGFVLGHEAREKEILWTDLRWRIAGSPPAPEAGSRQRSQPAESRRARKQRIRSLALGYREVLATLAEQGPTAAQRALFDLESNALVEGSDRGPELLEAAELQVAEKLSQSTPETLLPVLLLHGETYRSYRTRRLYSLIFHASAMVEKLAQLYAEAGSESGAPATAARALISLAGHRQEANLPATSRRLFRAALELDATHRVALLGLATSYERYGNYREATDVLEQLVAAHPSFAEGLLRLAINLDRFEIRHRPPELVARVLELEAPDWVHSVAYQFQAHHALDRGNLGQAVEIMERSREELGARYGSAFLLAFLYDRTWQPHLAQEVLSAAESPSRSSAEGSESARKRYDSWPVDAFAAVRLELASAAAESTARLAPALAAIREEEE